MFFTRNEKILLAMFGGRDAFQTKKNLSMAALLAEDAAAQKVLGELVQHFSAEVKKGLDCEQAFEWIREEVQPKLMVSLTVFDEKTDDYICVYPIRQLVKCLLMKAFGSDSMRSTSETLEHLQNYIPDEWFSGVVEELREDICNVEWNENWMYPEIRDSSNAVAGAVQWFCSAPDLPEKARRLPEKKRGTAAE